jgi:transposase
MEECIGLDVSMKETSVSIRRAGKRIWRGKCGIDARHAADRGHPLGAQRMIKPHRQCASDPRIVAELIRKRAPAVKRVVFVRVLGC